MEVTIKFHLDETWDNYRDIDPELLIEDMFNSQIFLKEGISITDVKLD